MWLGLQDTQPNSRIRGWTTGYTAKQQDTWLNYRIHSQTGYVAGLQDTQANRIRVAIRWYNIYLKTKTQKNETVKREGLLSLEIMHIRVRHTRSNGCRFESTRLFITFYERTRLSRLFCTP